MDSLQLFITSSTISITTWDTKCRYLYLIDIANMNQRAAAWVHRGVHVAYRQSNITSAQELSRSRQHLYPYLCKDVLHFAITNYYKTFKCENNTVYIEKKLSLRFKWIRKIKYLQMGDLTISKNSDFVKTTFRGGALQEYARNDFDKMLKIAYLRQNLENPIIGLWSETSR